MASSQQITSARLAGSLAFGIAARREGFGPFGNGRRGFTLAFRREGQLKLLGFPPLSAHEKRVLLAAPFSPLNAGAVRAFGRAIGYRGSALSHSMRLPTMPSADFCVAVRGSRVPLSLLHGACALRAPGPLSRPHPRETRRRPPGVSSSHSLHRTPAGYTAEAIDGYGLRDNETARPARTASYPVSVRQVAALLGASFRPRLAATPLRFTSTSPPSGCAGDFHPQAAKHARHTTKRLRRRGGC